MPHQLQTVCQVILKKKKKTKVKIFTHLLLGQLRLVVVVVGFLTIIIVITTIIHYSIIIHNNVQGRYEIPHTHSKMPLCLLFFSPHKFIIELNNFLFSSLIMVYAMGLPDAIHRQNEVYTHTHTHIYIHLLPHPHADYQSQDMKLQTVEWTAAAIVSFLSISRFLSLVSLFGGAFSLSSGLRVVGRCSR